MTDDTEMETETRADAASPEAVDRLAREYVEAGRPFARVTVVRREPPVSARVGDRALVTADGDLEGWIGGVACAQSVAVREAQAVLRTGEPKLVGIAPDPDTVDRPGLEAFPMTCHSQGTLELFIEPVLAVPRLVVVGDSPIARALADLAGGLSHEVATLGSDVDSDTLADALAGATWVVAASMGATDEGVVAVALEQGVPYVGLVASHRRADDLCGRVADRLGRDPESVREAVSSPAGLDIGAATPEEVGVSILAELVSVRRTGDVERPPADGGGEAGTASETDREVAVDPVCGMDVVVGEAAATATHEDTTFHFCGTGCHEAFVDDPERFLSVVET